jgi:hypothetical protein
MSLDYELTRFLSRKSALSNQIRALDTDFQVKVRKLEEALGKLDEVQDRILIAVTAYKRQVERTANIDLRRAERRIKELERQIETGGFQIRNDADISAVAKGRTLAIFDAILFNISNWSTTGDTAPDFELASQAILFPAVYEHVMSGPDEYRLDRVPVGALEVIRRGREWVKHLRQTCSRSLADPEAWQQHQPAIVKWWLDDALPIIYEERNPDWDSIEPFSQQEMVAWRDFPANRPLSFPLIFDGMEIIKQHSEEIRETSGIPELDKKATQTRLDPL